MVWYPILVIIKLKKKLLSFSCWLFVQLYLFLFLCCFFYYDKFVEMGDRTFDLKTVNMSYLLSYTQMNIWFREKYTFGPWRFKIYNFGSWSLKICSKWSSRMLWPASWNFGDQECLFWNFGTKLTPTSNLNDQICDFSLLFIILAIKKKILNIYFGPSTSKKYILVNILWITILIFVS